MPYSGPMNSTSTDHIVQIENPMCSDRMENHRFRLAILAPVRSQKPSSSGFHSSIQRPANRERSAVFSAAVVVTPNLRRLRFRYSTTHARNAPFPAHRPDVTAAKTSTGLVTTASPGGHERSTTISPPSSRTGYTRIEKSPFRQAPSVTEYA